MKYFVLGICVSVCIAFLGNAQSNTDPRASMAESERQRIDQFLLEKKLAERSRGNNRDHPPGDSVVSLQRLGHTPNRQALRLEKKAMAAYSKQRYPKALELLKSAAEIDPDSSTALNNLGVTYCALGHDEEAEQAFRQAIAADTGAAISYSNLASVAFNTYQYRLAETSARQAVRLSPRYEQAQVMLALAEVAQGHWTAEAKQLLKDNRDRFQQAKQILESWPSSAAPSNGVAKHVTIRGAGPGAFVPGTMNDAKSNFK